VFRRRYSVVVRRRTAYIYRLPLRSAAILGWSCLVTSCHSIPSPVFLLVRGSLLAPRRVFRATRRLSLPVTRQDTTQTASSSRARTPLASRSSNSSSWHRGSSSCRVPSSSSRSQQSVSRSRQYVHQSPLPTSLPRSCNIHSNVFLRDLDGCLGR